MANPLPVHRAQGDVRGGGPSSRCCLSLCRRGPHQDPSREVGLSLLRGELEAALS